MSRLQLHGERLAYLCQVDAIEQNTDEATCKYDIHKTIRHCQCRARRTNQNDAWGIVITGEHDVPVAVPGRESPVRATAWRIDLSKTMADRGKRALTEYRANVLLFIYVVGESPRVK